MLSKFAIVSLVWKLKKVVQMEWSCKTSQLFLSQLLASFSNGFDLLENL